MRKADAVEIIAQSGSIGAEIRGFDLSKKLSDDGFAQINQAFLDYQVLFFREQRLDHQQYCDFASRFGPLQEYIFAEGIEGFPYITEIVKSENESEGFGSFWHSDSTYNDRPPKATLLYARQLPPRGGDTLFSDMYAARASLSEGMLQSLQSLKVVNSASVLPRDEDIHQQVKSRNSQLKHRQAIHPLIRSHDETGKQAIYVNGAHSLSIDGMSAAESRPILAYLCRLVEKPEFQFRLHWQENMLAIWDNRCTQHYALNDYQGYRRVMHRVIVEGGRPQ